MTVLLRPAVEADPPAVGALHFRSRRSAYAGLFSPEALNHGSPTALGEWWAERWRWERETHRLTVADADGELVGFTYLGPTPDPGVTELYAIHVAPERVGRGVGRLLMLDALPHLGARAVLWVLDGNTRARRFYERGGWVPDGATRDQPMGSETARQLRYSRTRTD
ncbi:ribosomal protein S18 acetylase RimI-like enzyme [Krasilnikovia cinnamomea]|uniref:Ribosomal protein S18 acetylase RimI-like enzyme n=1 Tax=Krasilnikovia cinnamomea TaxID=349313 RepID=A0A4Q7ZMC4_9ACTN|nr:GNAT family N-acetyltransferase [Krasilnikovia cinnamomea]RZU52137.1 ribosomal protein S18 acetylase RimI-like enzyme [Krasilnikovia cinnamomea]